MEVEQLKKLVEDIINGLMLKAREKRAAIPYSKTDGFPITLVFLGPNLEVVVLPITWNDEREKREKMQVVSETAREMFCTAVILITDTRWTDSGKIAPLLGLPPIEEVGVDKWQKLYSNALRDKFKGYLGNAPPEFYSEALVVICKGPRIGTLSRMVMYEKGENDGIRWLRNPYEFGERFFNLLPDWWV